MHVGRSPQRGDAVLDRALQSLLVEAAGLPETTLGDPEVRQSDGTSDQVSSVPRLGQTGHAFGVPTERGIEIRTRPVGQAKEGCCRSTPHMIIFIGELERPGGMGQRAGHIAAELGKSRSMPGDRAG